MKKLPPKMLAVLKALSIDAARAHYMPYLGRFRPRAYYYISCGIGHELNHQSCTAQIKGLLERGLVNRSMSTANGHEVRINYDGRMIVQGSK